ncbi:YitT family protein [Psychrobacillus sp. FSL H8-0483]|uniref:YitT family protein n=1 Tax=Psychrobacillus sp. FSL H8-0483 TaxID=2921389 RepID=UPI00315A502A
MYFVKKSIVIVIGSILISLGINLFLVPYKVLDGGIIGIGLILNYLWGLKAGLTIIVLSIPIFIIAWVSYRDYFYNSLHGMIISSLFIDFLKTNDSLFLINPVYSSILGGVLVGSGIGLMLRFRTSTGGTDLIAQFLCDKTGINVGILIFFIDSFVILLGGILLSTDTLFLSVITIMFVALTTSLFTRNVVQA